MLGRKDYYGFFSPKLRSLWQLFYTFTIATMELQEWRSVVLDIKSYSQNGVMVEQRETRNPSRWIERDGGAVIIERHSGAASMSNYF